MRKESKIGKHKLFCLGRHNKTIVVIEHGYFLKYAFTLASLILKCSKLNKSERIVSCEYNSMLTAGKSVLCTRDIFLETKL